LLRQNEYDLHVMDDQPGIVMQDALLWASCWVKHTHGKARAQ
jgi:hypothetical protein